MHRTRLLYRKTPSDENGSERARRGGRPSCYIRFSNALQLMETARYLCVEVDDSGGVGRTSVGMADECRRPPPTREVGKFGRFARAVRRITTSWTFASQANVTSSIEITTSAIRYIFRRRGQAVTQLRLKTRTCFNGLLRISLPATIAHLLWLCRVLATRMCTED